MMDVPIDPWTAEDVRFWTQTPTRYCPWKDVARFFSPLDKAPGTGTGMLTNAVRIGNEK